MSQDSTLEYVCITMASGAVDTVTPDNPDTKTALDAGKKGGLVAAINKMAEYQYKLLEGTKLVMECSLGGAFVAVFMYRQK